MTDEDGTSDRNGHGMGDERSGGSPDRRRARPEESARGGARSYDQEQAPFDDSPLEALLAAAIRGGKAEGEAERRAVAAFRAARDAGAHRARTRRRDDWRPRARWRTVRSLRTTLSVLLASLTLGGVAYAAIGSVGGGPARGAAGDGSADPSAVASTPAESPSASGPSVSAPADRPPTAKDTLAHCRVYEKLRSRGEAPDSTAFQRLVEAAGGEANVSAYCAGLTGGTAAAGASDADDAKPGKGKANAGKNADKNTSKKP
ncbi:hypothetical protein ACI2L1_39085 [Streptomyces sp. NPDC019531]|uniref:hypothetical protein n=1 Tax=Streptomyces sp. NPDC019531 TaxID=3365062 RepID=UPI00384D0E3E